MWLGEECELWKGEFALFTEGLECVRYEVTSHEGSHALDSHLTPFLSPQSTRRTSGTAGARSSGRASRSASWACWRTSRGPRPAQHGLFSLGRPPAGGFYTEECDFRTN